MIYRILISLAVLAIVAVAALSSGNGSVDIPVAPATSNPDEARFKGLTVN